MLWIWMLRSVAQNSWKITFRLYSKWTCVKRSKRKNHVNGDTRKTCKATHSTPYKGSGGSASWSQGILQGNDVIITSIPAPYLIVRLNTQLVEPRSYASHSEISSSLDYFSYKGISYTSDENSDVSWIDKRLVSYRLYARIWTCGVVAEILTSEYLCRKKEKKSTGIEENYLSWLHHPVEL